MLVVYYIFWFVKYHIFVCVCVFRHHGQTLRLKRHKFSMWSPSNQVSIISHIWVVVVIGEVFVIATPTKVVLPPKRNQKTNQAEIWCAVSKYPGEHY